MYLELNRAQGHPQAAPSHPGFLLLKQHRLGGDCGLRRIFCPIMRCCFHKNRREVSHGGFSRRIGNTGTINWCLKESNAHRPYCRGGIHASRAHGTFSPKRRENRNVSPPGGMNASPTVFFQRFLNGPTNTNSSGSRMDRSVGASRADGNGAKTTEHRTIASVGAIVRCRNQNYRCFQVLWEKSTRIGKISSRPASISAISTSLDSTL